MSARRKRGGRFCLRGEGFEEPEPRLLKKRAAGSDLSNRRKHHQTPEGPDLCLTDGARRQLLASLWRGATHIGVQGSQERENPGGFLFLSFLLVLEPAKQRKMGASRGAEVLGTNQRALQ